MLQSKPFVLLHPTSFFASNPEVLELDDKDIIETGVGHEMKGQVSAKHQLLAFVRVFSRIYGTKFCPTKKAENESF